MTPIDPPRWSDEELEVDRRAAIARFRDERLQEPLEQYLETFDTYRGVVEDLLETTVDLTKLSPPDVQVLTDPDLLLALRYLAGPPISQDDLKELAEASLAPSRLASDSDMALRVVETILTALDRRRFPWVAEGREPEPAEREAAALASAALIATQRLSTERRSSSKDAQEQAVADALVGVGFAEVPTRTIQTLDKAPLNGEFCRESMFGTRKADFVVGLWDGRKMPVECKVSNSSTNSVKRLNNDAAVKATRWIEEFGTAQTVPAAVIGGVFKAHNLKAAQESGLSIFWAHKLESMLNWIETTR
ncbi:MAG TPA: XamI family restriction endonuclease [Solirubrobacterales bacterium]|jgi:AcrR family transcriptional regulator|nr:XamI family restriction endonuclease [Solirubrobacterales bacterium]